MFGAKISNLAGSTIIGDGERSFLYWGKKTVSLSSATNWGTGSVLVSLFNIPLSVPITMFAASSASSGNGALIQFDDSGFTHQARCMANSACNVEIYVFVDSNFVQKPNYGMVIFELHPRIKWHSGRPSISYKDVRIETNNLNALNPVSVPYKAAVQVGGIYGSTMTSSSQNSAYDGYVWHFNATTSGGFNHGMIATRVIGTTGGYFDGEYYAYNTDDLDVTYFTIDAGYYDQFTNLQNYA